MEELLGAVPFRVNLPQDEVNYWVGPICMRKLRRIPTIGGFSI